MNNQIFKDSREIQLVFQVVKIEQEKIKVVKKWKTPTKIKDVESFIGFANFYRHFIQNFSHTATPLNELTGKTEWEWNKDHH